MNENNFLSVLCRIMSKTAARQTIEESRSRQAEECERFQAREDAYRRSRQIRHDFDYNPYYYGQGGIKI